MAASQPAGVRDRTVPPGAGYDKAEFRFWSSPESSALRGVVVLVPGSDGDGRAMAEEPLWQEFAARHRMALVACRFTDKPHEQGFIEEYANAPKGSGQALLDALGAFGAQSGREAAPTGPDEH